MAGFQTAADVETNVVDGRVRLAREERASRPVRSQTTAPPRSEAEENFEAEFVIMVSSRKPARRLSLMTSRPHTIELKPDAFELVSREAERRGVSTDQVVEEIIRTDLAVVPGGDLDAALRRAATLRSTLPRLDGVVLAREARADLQARGA